MSDTIDTIRDTIDTISDTISPPKNFTDEECIILNILKADPTLTQTQVQEKTYYSLSTVKRIMTELKKRGVITRTGNNRSGKWRINV